MKPNHLERLASAISAPRGGIVGLVDEVLAVSREAGLTLDWQAAGCKVWDGRAWADVPGTALRKSVFRAALARFAVLCDERTPDGVSPYGGQGEIAVGTPPAVLRVAFTNTTAEQSLRLTSGPTFPAYPAAGHVPAGVPVGRGADHSGI